MAKALSMQQIDIGLIHWSAFYQENQEFDSVLIQEESFKLSGFSDRTIPELLHYFSVGRIPQTQIKKQGTTKARELYKQEHTDDIYAANIAYKHQQAIEMLPFFVRSEFQTEENLKTLCRVPHYLRISPAYTKGNISLPYPMHLGMKLIEDLLCILGLES